MADNKKSWLSNLFQSKEARQADAELKSLKKQLDKIIDVQEEFEDYSVKFLDSEPSTYSSPGKFEMGGIEQTINNATLQRVYTTETWVYIPVTAIAKTIAGLPIKLEKKTKINKRVLNEITGLEEDTVQEHWIDASGEKLFERFQYPNKYCTQTEFTMLTVIDLMTTGEYFVYLDSDEDLSLISESDFDNNADSPFGRLRNILAANTAINGMYRLPPALMKPVMDQEKPYKVAGYVMESDKGRYVYDAAEIIHVKLPNPLNPHAGLPPLIPAFKPVLLDRFSTEHMIRFYKTGARLGGIIQTDKAMNKEQIARFQRSFENDYTGRHNFHRTLVLPNGMQYKQIEQNPAETALLEFCKYNRDTMLSIYGVPPIKVGILDNANYANARAQLETFFTDTIIPLLAFIEDGYNLKNTLMPDTRTFRIKFDLSDVDALQDDLLAKANAGKEMINAGLSINEVRRKVWKAGPVKDGDKVKVIEDMSKPAANPFIGAMAEHGETKDAVSGSPQPDSAQIASDLNPTGLSFNERVTQLTILYMQQDKLSMADAIARAIEQAKAEGLKPEDEKPPEPPTPSPSGGNGAPESSDLPKGQAPDVEKTSGIPTLNQFIADAVSKLNENEPITPEFIAELTSIYNEQYNPQSEKEAITADAPKTYAFGYTKDQIVDHWKGFVSKMDPLIEKRAIEVRGFFKKFKSRLMNQIGANIKAYGMHKARNEDDVNEILDEKHYDDLLKGYVAEIDAILLEAYKHGFMDTLVNFKFDMPNETAIKYLKQYAADKVVGIADTTREQMRQVLSDAFEEGVAVTEVAQRINEKFAEIDAGRAMTIARTETLTAVSMGQEEKRQEFQDEFPEQKLKKMWVSAQDDKVRDSHQELDGQTREADEEFKDGLRYPRDPNGAAEEVINCRCTLIDYAEQDEALVQTALPEKGYHPNSTKVHRGENETFDECISRAMPILVGEGHDRQQAYAMAHSMCQLPRKAEKPSGVVQTIIVSKEIADSREAAAKIASDFGSTHTIRETSASYRFRQRPPSDFKPGGYRTFSPKNGVTLIYGQLKDEKGGQGSGGAREGAGRKPGSGHPSGPITDPSSNEPINVPGDPATAKPRDETPVSASREEYVRDYKPVGPAKISAADNTNGFGSERFINVKGKDLDIGDTIAVHGLANKEIVTTVKPMLLKAVDSIQADGIQVVDRKIRGKKPDSALEKMHGKWADKTLDQTTDNIGMRLVVKYQKDADAVTQNIEKYLGMKVVENSDTVVNSKAGYRAQHVLVKTPSGMIAEVQIKTKNQDTWSRWSHDKIYKNPKLKDLPEVRKYAEAVSDHLHAIDMGKKVSGIPPKPPRAILSAGLEFPWDKTIS